MIPAQYNFPPMIQGDTWTQWDFTITVDSVPKNLTSASIAIDIRDSKGRLQVALRNGSGITITDAAAGKFSIGPFATTDWDAGIYKYDCRITVGGIATTYFGGERRLIEGVTQ